MKEQRGEFEGGEGSGFDGVGGCRIYSLAVFRVPFGSLGSSRFLLPSVGSAPELCETNLDDFSAQG